jgi:hypothetical protein
VTAAQRTAKKTKTVTHVARGKCSTKRTNTTNFTLAPGQQPGYIFVYEYESETQLSQFG